MVDQLLWCFVKQFQAVFLVISLDAVPSVFCSFRFVTIRRDIVQTFFNIVKALNSRHLRILKNYPLLRGVRYWEVNLKRLSHLELTVLSAIWNVRYWEASLYLFICYVVLVKTRKYCFEAIRFSHQAPFYGKFRHYVFYWKTIENKNTVEVTWERILITSKCYFWDYWTFFFLCLKITSFLTLSEMCLHLAN